MNGTGAHNVKGKKPGSERHTSHFLSYEESRPNIYYICVYLSINT
jgi:hypothetical protein